MILLLFIGLFGLNGLNAADITISGRNFLLDGQPFDMWGIRMASATIEQSYTNELLAHLSEYKSYGINTVTVFYMGSSGGMEDPFTTDGSAFRSGDGVANHARMVQIIETCDALDMVVVVGIFYQFKSAEPIYLANWEASKEAVRTVTSALSSYDNVIINIANEQNSNNYDGKPWSRVKNVSDILELCSIVKQIDPDRLVGAGGYDDDKNDAIGQSSITDCLLFDTLNAENSLSHYTRFVNAGVTGPIVNVESFGGWTKRFSPPGGNFKNSSGNDYLEYLDEADRAAAQPGLNFFFHANPWYQGESVGEQTRFDIGGSGTSSDPGVRWYLEYLRDDLGLGGPDTVAPSISSLNTPNATHVRVVFSEAVSTSSTENTSNYSINNGISVQSANALSGNEVELTTSALSSGVTYTLTVNGVLDLASPPNGANDAANFSYTQVSSLQAEDVTLGGGAVVESNHAGYNGSGFVNLPSSGGYVEWANVDGELGGEGQLKFRYALGSSSRTVNLTINGQTESLTFSPTGSWSDWQVVTANATLNSGSNNTIRITTTGNDSGNIDELEVIGGQGGGNQAPVAVNDSVTMLQGQSVLVDVLANDSDPDSGPQSLSVVFVSVPTEGDTSIESNQVRFTPTSGFVGSDTIIYRISDGSDEATAVISVTVNPSGGSSQTYQAEDYSSQSGVSIETDQSGYTGSGFVDYGGNGTWAEWNDINAGAGSATITFVYANGNSGNRQCALTVNGSNQGTLTFASTGSWTTWASTSVNVTLNAGNNTIRLTANTSNGGPNLDKLEVTGSGGSDTQAPSTPTGLTASNVTTTSVDLDWNASSDNVGVTGYNVYVDGIYADQTGATSIQVSPLSSGTQYTFTVSSVDAASNESSQSTGINVTTSTGNTPLISEDFSTSAGSFSMVAGGDWNVSGGRYVLSSPAAGVTGGFLENISVHNTIVSGDFSLSATVRITPSGVWDDASIIFGYQNVNNYYHVSLNEGNNGTTMGVFKIHNGVLTELSDISATISGGVDYSLEIERTGSSITVVLDGTPVASTSDSTFTTGKVGFGSYNDGAQFDDLVVY